MNQQTPPTYYTAPNKTTSTRTKSWQEKSIGKLANTVEEKIANNRSRYENNSSSGRSICDSIFSDISLLSRPQLADSPPRPQHTTITSSSSNSNKIMNLGNWVDSQQKISQTKGTHDMCSNSVLTDEMNNEQLQQRHRGRIGTKHTDGYRLPKPPTSSSRPLKKPSPSSPTSIMSRKVIAPNQSSSSKSSSDNSFDSPRSSKSKSTAGESILDESSYDTGSSGGYNSPEQSVSTRSSIGNSNGQQQNDVSYWKAAKMRAKLLKTNNDKLQSENQRLSTELSTLSNHHSMEIKKLELELQAERNRRLQISHEVSLKQAEHELLNEKLSNVESAKVDVSRRLDDTVNELYNAKSQLMKTSHELSKKQTEIDILDSKADMSRQLEDTMLELSHIKSQLATSQEDLVNVKEELHMTKAELKIEKTTLSQQENECAYLYEDNGRIKKEHSDAIQIAQMYKAEVDQVKIDMDETKQELESALSDSRHYKSALGNAQKEVHAKGEQLWQARHQVKAMITNHDTNLSTLEEIASTEKKTRKDTQAILEDTQGQLSIAERAVEDLREALASLQSDKATLDTRLSALEDLNDRLDTVLRPIPQQLEALLPNSKLIEAPTQDAHSNLEPEYLSECISKLIAHISDYSKELNESIKSRDGMLEETQLNLLYTADHLEKLEAEHDMIKTELVAKQESLCQKEKEYSYMCDQYSDLTAKVKSDKIALQKKLTNVFSELETTHADVHQFKQSLDKTQKDLDSKDKQLCQAQYQVKEFQEKYDKLKRGSLREKKIRVDTQGKLSEAEKRIDELNQKVSELSCKLKEHETPLITRVVDLKNAFLGGGSVGDMSDITELNK